MKTAAEYMALAFEFQRMANTSPDPVFKKRYADPAECYRISGRSGQAAAQTAAANEKH
jgi:hypothetical protein